MPSSRPCEPASDVGQATAHGEIQEIYARVHVKTHESEFRIEEYRLRGSLKRSCAQTGDLIDYYLRNRSDGRN